MTSEGPQSAQERIEQSTRRLARVEGLYARLRELLPLGVDIEAAEAAFMAGCSRRACQMAAYAHPAAAEGMTEEGFARRLADARDTLVSILEVGREVGYQASAKEWRYLDFVAMLAECMASAKAELMAAGQWPGWPTEQDSSAKRTDGPAYTI